MYVEITKECFRAIVSIECKCAKVENLEHAIKHYYHEKGCELLTINNYLSCCPQYYVKDINA